MNNCKTKYINASRLTLRLSVGGAVGGAVGGGRG